MIGVSITGVATGNVMGLNFTEASRFVVEENKRVANIIGINPSARCTTIKPEGTSSLVLGTSSGLHAWHNDYYIRRIRVGKNEAIYQYLKNRVPSIIEDDFFKPESIAIISIPQKAPEGSILRTESAISTLERLKVLQEKWIYPGHNLGDNKNNVSCTISVRDDEWGNVGNWMWANKEKFTAIAVLPYDGGTYTQPPYEDIDAETYESLIGKLKSIDLSHVLEIEDKTDLQSEAACAGGACEVT